MDRLRGMEVSEEVRVQGQGLGSQAGIQQSRGLVMRDDKAWFRNPNGSDRPEHRFKSTGVNSPMSQSEETLTPTAPPKTVIMGPNEQCGVPVTPGCEGNVDRQGLNTPLPLQIQMLH